MISFPLTAIHELKLFSSKASVLTAGSQQNPAAKSSKIARTGEAIQPTSPGLLRSQNQTKLAFRHASDWSLSQLTDRRAAPAHLTWRLHTLELSADVQVGPAAAEVVQTLVSRREEPRLHHVDADHGARATLAALAVDGHHVLGVCVQPVDDRRGEVQHLSAAR